MQPPQTELSLDGCLARHRRIGWRGALVVVDSIDSTNRLARRIGRVYLEGGLAVPSLALLARGQSGGRGRRGNSWISPAGQGIYTSLLLGMEDAAELAALPLRVPLALCEALEGFGVDCGIKWPNDLVADGGKLGGVLIESLSGGRAVIIGYGINAGQTEADLPVAEATSLRLVSGDCPDISKVAVDLAEEVMRRLTEGEPRAGLVEAYGEHSVHQPGERLICRLSDEVVEGSFVGFDELGRLRLGTDSGERVLSAVELLSEAAPGLVTGLADGDEEAAGP